MCHFSTGLFVCPVCSRWTRGRGKAGAQGFFLVLKAKRKRRFICRAMPASRAGLASVHTQGEGLCICVCVWGVCVTSLQRSMSGHSTNENENSVLWWMSHISLLVPVFTSFLNNLACRGENHKILGGFVFWATAEMRWGNISPSYGFIYFKELYVTKTNCWKSYTWNKCPGYCVTAVVHAFHA